MPENSSRVWECSVCGNLYDEAKEGVPWEELPDAWECPVCGAPRSEFGEIRPATEEGSTRSGSAEDIGGGYLAEWARPRDEHEVHMADIHRMAVTGQSIIEPMRAPATIISWDEILIKGAQLARFPLNADELVSTRTVIGPRARQPLVIDTPIYVTHMSFGALSREVKLALAKGTAAVNTATCSGEGGIISETLKAAYRYIFEYVPNRYSLTDENLRAADAVEIKIGQSAKPGLGGYLPGTKVTDEIAKVRGFPAGQSITSPARFSDIRNKDELKEKVSLLRHKSGGRPIGIKLAAGNLEADLKVALQAEPDFITIDGRLGATGAAPKFIKAACSVPTIFALYRARKYLDKHGGKEITLVVTGGLRVSADFAKALALGADAVAIGTAALMACACQQYRMCHTGRCPVGVATQDPELRARFDVDESARRLANYLRVCTEELKDFSRMTGNADVHGLGIRDLCTANSEISEHTDIEHV